MKKLIATAIVFLSINSVAQAREAGPAWICSLHGKLSGESGGIVISTQRLEGRGLVQCVSATGVTASMPVKMEIKGFGLGLGFSEYTEVEVATAGIGVATGPQALTGSYAVGPSAGVTLVQAGLDVGLAMRMSGAGGLSFELGVLGKQGRGLEAKLQMQSFEVTPIIAD